MPEVQVTVAEAVREIRKQLSEASAEGAGQDLRFIAKSVEVELGITFSLEKEAGGGLKLWSILDLSGKAKTSDESTHKIKLVLEPVGGVDGKPKLISDDQREK